MKIGKNITISTSGKKLGFFYKGSELTALVKEFSLGINIPKYLDIKAGEGDLSWEFAKEMHRYGFHVNYWHDSNRFEFYYRNNSDSKVEGHYLLHSKTGEVITKYRESQCRRCPNLIEEGMPWCLNLHS